MYTGHTIKCRNGMVMLVCGLVFLCALLGVDTFSAAQEGEGEPEPIPIATIEELQKIGNDPGYPLNGSYVLTQDIDASATATWNDGAGFSPIAPDTDTERNGYQGTKFTGSFDGQGHTIANLTINRPDEDYVSLFGYTTGATIQNVALEDMNVSGASYVGSLVGFAGYSNTITGSYSTGAVSGNSSAGGLVGYNEGTILSCYATGAVTSNDGNYIGGLVGCNTGGDITACYATGTVTGTFSVGGLIGLSQEYCDFSSGDYWSAWVTECYATGVVTGQTSVGGLIGSNRSVVRVCYSTGMVTGNGGGLIGGNSGSSAACFWDIESSSNDNSAAGIGLTTIEMQDVSVFSNAGWDAYDWVMVENSYPRLAWEGLGWPEIPAATIPFEGSGTETDPYLITSADEFAFLSWLAPILNAHIHLANDIDLSGVALYPIGEMGSFSGVFDGNGYLLQNAVIHLPNRNNVGIFRESSGSIRNLGLTNVDIIGGSYVGGLVGLADYRSSITGSYSTGTVSGDSYIGGLVGLAGYRSSITGSYSTGTVTGVDCIGGLVGCDEGGAITRCYATGTVTGIYAVGGLLGLSGTHCIYDLYMGEICWAGQATECYATGVVTGQSSVGGLIGKNTGNVSACYATGAVTGQSSVGGLIGSSGLYDGGTVRACYSTGMVTGNGGGLMGSNTGSSTACFWNIESSSRDSSAAGRGLTTLEMQKVSIFSNAGWDAYDWVMVENNYPRLSWEGLGWPEIPAATIPFEGSGTEADPYLITSADEFSLLSWLAPILNAHIHLANDIDLAGVALCPIGDMGSFSGVFDGNGYLLQNVVIHLPYSDYMGIFRENSGIIRNLGVTNVDIIGGSTVGGLVGYLFDGAIITDCHVSGKVTGTSSVGGLAGWIDNQAIYPLPEKGVDKHKERIDGGVITSCYTSTTVRGSGDVGGLAGYNMGNITSCYATGSVTSDSGNTGGLVGRNVYNITFCYATGSVTSDSGNTGGLVGHNSTFTDAVGNIKSCYATGSVEGNNGNTGGLVGYNSKSYSIMGNITSCYATGSVRGDRTVGGLVGSNDGNITSCYWDRTTSGLSISDGGTGLTTVLMMQQSSYTDWDFYCVWGIDEGKSYPYLRGFIQTIEDDCEPPEGEGESEGESGEGESGEGESGEGESGEGESGEGESGEGESGEGESGEGESDEGESDEGESGEEESGEGEPAEGEGESEEGEHVPETTEEIAETLLEQFDATDTDHDGWLSAEEALALLPGLTSRQFNEMDADGNGLISRDELLDLLQPEGESVEGEGEPEPPDDTRGGCCSKGCSSGDKLNKHLGDWLLVGMSMLILFAYTSRHKQM